MGCISHFLIVAKLKNVDLTDECAIWVTALDFWKQGRHLIREKEVACMKRVRVKQEEGSVLCLFMCVLACVLLRVCMYVVGL
jgi:hypothetical protein